MEQPYLVTQLFLNQFFSPETKVLAKHFRTDETLDAKNTHFGRFGGTENGTLGAQIKILRPLFNTNTPP